ncbi:thiol reductant ABC exporter subunit CydD [Agrobacterium rosae]|uniref:Thiol reductant ABC exporter subunit CydD n=1 Tax=Agrobacterium rosae TaxID=1972867 RepID=A0ABU4W7T8_9HYPH|nr:thiol reductant ABC exporter subunit CydD [Agrobacterium rosae]MDX8332923.1 thiol reductant ABC exporter subunit CydD [Agrobacterium rosae]
MRDNTAKSDRQMSENTSKEAGSQTLSALRHNGGKAIHIAMAMPLFSGMLLVGQVFLLSSILDAAIVAGRPLASLWPSIAALATLLVMRAGLGFIGDYAGALGSELIKKTLRDNLVAHLLVQRSDWVHVRASGALAGTVVDQVEALDGYFSRFLPATIQAGLLPIVFAAVVMPFDWVVGMLFLFTAPMILLFMALVGWGAQAASDAQTDALSRLSGYFADRLRGLMTLKLFGRMDIEATAMHDATDELRRRTLRVLRIAFLSSAVLEFFSALGVAGVALYVGLSYLDMVDLRFEPLSLQTGLFCLLMAPEVYQPLRTLAAHYHDRSQAKSAIAETLRLFGEMPLCGPIAKALRTGDDAEFRGVSISARDLSLSAPGGGPSLLDPTALFIAAGSHIALLGQSGSGKTTLLKALARLGALGGTVHLGDLPQEEIEETQLRRMLAFIPQRPRLFQGSIADNIRFANPAATDAEVRRAADLAMVTDFARDLPKGLKAAVGEGGLGLSGGEAHRVGLARLFVTNPSIILLDEPTAHLDAESEAAVLAGIIEFARYRTLVIATHSQAVAAHLKKSLRLEDCRLVASGMLSPVFNREHAA